MKLYQPLAFVCLLIIAFSLSIGCDKLDKPYRVVIDPPEKPLEPGDDPDKALPQIAVVGDFEPGKYRMRVGNYQVHNSKLVRIGRTIGSGVVKVFVFLNPAPLATDVDNVIIVSVGTEDGAIVPEEVVVEITKKLRVAGSIHEYEGIIIKNLSRPDIVIRYDEEDENL